MQRSLLLTSYRTQKTAFGRPRVFNVIMAYFVSAPTFSHQSVKLLTFTEQLGLFKFFRYVLIKRFLLCAYRAGQFLHRPCRLVGAGAQDGDRLLADACGRGGRLAHLPGLQLCQDPGQASAAVGQHLYHCRCCVHELGAAQRQLVRRSAWYLDIGCMLLACEQLVLLLACFWLLMPMTRMFPGRWLPVLSLIASQLPLTLCEVAVINILSVAASS